MFKRLVHVTDEQLKAIEKFDEEKSTERYAELINNWPFQKEVKQNKPVQTGEEK